MARLARIRDPGVVNRGFSTIGFALVAEPRAAAGG